MKHIVYTNSTKTLQIVDHPINRSYVPEFEVYSYGTWVADIYLHKNILPHIVILGDYLHYSKTTTNHIKTAIAWLIVNYGNPLTKIDGDKTDIRLNKPPMKCIKDGAIINGIRISIV